MAGPLNGIRVLDATWVLAGPYCTMLLCDLGAEVLKVERPNVGDTVRGTGPFINGQSIYFASLNRGKKSVTIDLDSPQGKELFLKLAEHSDVLVENFLPGVMDRLGLDYEALRARNPRLIYATISGFGHSVPHRNRPALDVVIQGLSGMMSITGHPDGPPMRTGMSLGDIAAGAFAAIGILAALQERERSGLGQLLDLSMLDVQAALLENAYVRYLNTGEVAQRLGTRHPLFTPFQAFETADGYVVVAMVGGLKDQWPLFCAAIDRVDLIYDERFQDGNTRTAHYAELEPILADAMRQRTTAEWIAELAAMDIPCGPINDVAEAVALPHFALRDMIVSVDDPVAGPLRLVGTPFKLSRTPPAIDQPAPQMGEHTDAVLASMLGLDDDEIAALREEGVI